MTTTTDDTDEMIAELLAWSNEPARPPLALGNVDVGGLAALLRSALHQTHQHQSPGGIGFHGTGGWIRGPCAHVSERTYTATIVVRVEAYAVGSARGVREVWVVSVDGRSLCLPDGSLARFDTQAEAQQAANAAMSGVRLVTAPA